MSFTQLSNLELLSVLLGAKSAKRLYHGALRPLFLPTEFMAEPHPKLGAAHELVKRWLLEEMKRESVLRDPAAVRQYLRAYFAGSDIERFVGVFLDNQHRIIAVEELARGTIDGATVYAREVVKRTLANTAAAVIFAHNHPSGIAEPSAADRVLTEKLKSALTLLEVRTLDHFVIGEPDIVSFAERGWL